MKLMLVDDHPLFLEGLQYLLETNGLDVVGIVQKGRQALEKARLLKPNIILMDIKMPDFSGLDALRLIKAELPDIKVVMLTTSDEDQDLLDAIKYGASGYLLKNTNAKELVKMLADIDKGEVPISHGFAASLLYQLRSNDIHNLECPQQLSASSRQELLTERQIEVLELVAQGCTYKEVGDRLGLTERTIKYHMNRIIEELQFDNRSQVIAYAGRLGMIE